MLVLFEKIPAEGLYLTVNDSSWFPSQDFPLSGSVTASLYLARKGQQVKLEGRFCADVIFECDRCVEPYSQQLQAEFEIVFELNAPGMKPLLPTEYVCSSDEMDLLFLDEPQIDIFDILQQQVYLVVPSKKICSRECKGLCPKCGVNLNRKRCRCSESCDSSPFKILNPLRR